MSDDTNNGARVEWDARDGFALGSFEPPARHVDGHHTVTVRWDGESWCACLTGLDLSRHSVTAPLGHGMTKEDALLDLACSLAALCEAVAVPDQERDQT